MQNLPQPLSRVYALTDAQGRIVRLEGEYSLPADLTGWVLIEEGPPCDRLNLAQSHYLPLPLYTEDGVLRYKLEVGEIVGRTEEELEGDRLGLPTPEVQPTAQELMDAILELAAMMGG